MIIRVCLLGLFVFAATANGKTTIPSLLSDRTGFVLLVHDVSHVRTHIGETPLGRLWITPPADEAERSGLLAFRIQRQTGFTLPAILDRFEGEAALALPDFRYLLGLKENEEEAWAVVALTQNEAPWEELAKDMASANKKLGKTRTAKMAGHSVRVFVSGKKDSTLAWTWAQGTGVLTSSPRVLREMIHARKDASHLDQTENWRALEGRTQDGDITIFASLEGIASMVSERAAGGQADSLGAMMGIMPSSVMKALGLEAFRAARMTVSLLADEAQVDGGIIVRDEPGLARLLAYQPGPIERSSFIPSEAIFAHATRFRVSDFWNSCMEMMDQISPGVSYLARGQMEQIAVGQGLDFDADILGNFGEEFFTVYLPTTGAPRDTVPGDNFDQFSGIRVKDSAKAMKTMAALINWTSSVGSDEDNPTRRGTPGETRSVRGVDVTFREFGTAEKPSILSYAIVDSTLLVAKGGADIFERVLAARERGASLWKRPDIAPLLASVPREASSVSYWEPAALQRQLESSSKLKDETREVAKMLFLELGPSLMYTLKTPEGYFSRARLRRAFP